MVVHEFNTLEKLFSFVKNVVKLDRLVLKEYDKPKSGISLEEYFKWVEK